MAGRPRPTFNKLQRERARQEKQRAKAERKAQRKLEKGADGETPQSEVELGENPSMPEDVPSSEDASAS